MNNGTKIWITRAILVIVALFSIFVAAKYATSQEFHKKTLESLDEKRETVMELTGASTGVSVAITMIPGDAATPIADKLADLSSAFLLVLCAIYLEKYLVTLTGYATFYILIPAACALLLWDTVRRSEACRYMAKKLIFLGLAIVIAIPASVKVSDLIETTYQESIQQTIDTAKETSEAIEQDAAEEEEEESTGLFAGLINKVQETASSAVDKVEDSLNNFIEALAILIVTSCVIPVLVILFFVWLIKITLNADIRLPDKKCHHDHEHNH